MSKRTSDQYAVELLEYISQLFNTEGDAIIEYDAENTDWTEFFLGWAKAWGVFYNSITGEDKNLLECSYLINQLAVQDILQRKDKGGNE